MLRLCVFLVVLAGVVRPLPGAEEGRLDGVKSRLRSEFLGGGSNVRTVRGYCDSLKPDGSWPDIDYKDSTRSGWKTASHLSRVLQMSRALVDEESSLYYDSKLRDCTLKALDYWLENDFRNPNWWWPIIGTPRTLGEILLLLEGIIETETLEKGLPILKRTLDYPGYDGMTGANLIWVLRITIYYGILSGDAEHVRRASAKIAGEIRFVGPGREGGLLEDCSFIQHGPILYSHGYGAAFLSDSASIAAVLSGSEFAFPPEKVEILARMAIDGNQWLQRKGGADYIAEGRELVRPGQNARYLRGAAESLIEADSVRKEEFREIVRRFDNPNENPLTGNRGFWCTDTIAHHRPEFYFSVRMCSPRTTNSEIVNGEGLKSWYIGCGSNSIMRDGKEYVNISPLWDWTKIPGTTAPEIPGPEAKKVSFRGKREFVGLVSDGKNGIAGFDFALDTLRAKKSWFFFEDCVIALGCGISDTSLVPINTSLNQSLLRGKVEITIAKPDEEPKTIERKKGERENPHVSRIRHDGIAYIFPESRTVHLKNDRVEGTWRSISEAASGENVQGDVFLLYISHGCNPVDAKYAYFVTNDRKDEELDSLVESVRIVKNETKIQAVWSDSEKIGGAVFYEPGSVELAPGIVIEKDIPCFVFVCQNGNELLIHTSKPGGPPNVSNTEIK